MGLVDFSKTPEIKDGGKEEMIAWRNNPQGPMPGAAPETPATGLVVDFDKPTRGRVGAIYSRPIGFFRHGGKRYSTTTLQEIPDLFGRDAFPDDAGDPVPAAFMAKQAEGETEDGGAA